MKEFIFKTINILLISILTFFLFTSFNETKRHKTNNQIELSPDDILQQTAENALGQREGAIIVLDPQTGRVRAVVNKELAFEKALSPGSTIKPFTALTALNEGLIKEDSTLVCRAPYKREGFSINCVHGREEPPFDLVHALAHSCNFYFGKLGERINQKKFNATLSSFGFDEKIGKLPKGKWESRIAIGETQDLLVTPYNLINAYSALVNGGKLFTSKNKNSNDSFSGGLLPANGANYATQAGSSPLLNGREIKVGSEHRALLIEGMRGAVEYGTAEKANLDELPLNIFGKTGTASGDGNYRMQGWFIGFSADAETKGGVPKPNEINLAVLVFIKGAHGSDCAVASKDIFSAFDSEKGNREKESSAISGDVVFSPSPLLPLSPSSSLVGVKISKDSSVQTMPLEDYLAGVLAAESSIEDEAEALKAQVIASRTYALKHLKRHAKDGYDFCTLTHCQRFEFSAGERYKRAVKETQGQVLLDGNGDFAEAYFSASCGGATANLFELWGVESKTYLKTFRDDYCTEMPHSDWSAVISNEQMLKALQSDKRTNIGKHLGQIQIIEKDSSGRAEMLLLSGERNKKARGWDFKIIVGRVLGWNLIKSSRFSVKKQGKNFVFAGSGFGHGLGLCQEGAHVMAQRGFSYHQILARYFPTTTIAK